MTLDNLINSDLIEKIEKIIQSCITVKQLENSYNLIDIYYKHLSYFKFKRKVSKENKWKVHQADAYYNKLNNEYWAIHRIAVLYDKTRSI